MLNKKFNEQDVRQMFGCHGTIEECTVLRDQSGQSKGCAFVTYSTKPSAMAAIKVNIFLSKFNFVCKICMQLEVLFTNVNIFGLLVIFTIMAPQTVILFKIPTTHNQLCSIKTGDS